MKHCVQHIGGVQVMVCIHVCTIIIETIFEMISLLCVRHCSQYFIDTI